MGVRAQTNYLLAMANDNGEKAANRRVSVKGTYEVKKNEMLVHFMAYTRGKRLAKGTCTFKFQDGRKCHYQSSDSKRPVHYMWYFILM